jgi:hypothetical protein
MKNHNLSHSVPGVLDAFNGVLGRNILLFTKNQAAYLQDMFLQNAKLCELSMNLHIFDAFHKNRICLDTNKDVDFSSHAFTKK